MKKILWLLVSSLMALSLVIASCGPAVVEEEEEEEEVVVEEEGEEEEEVVVEKEKPQYGGVVTVLQTIDPRAFDESFSQNYSTPSCKLTNAELTTVDWCKGPAGTGENDLQNSVNNRLDIKAGDLAESWESPEPGHLIFKIRQGIHYGLNPDSEASRLVGGRELTADDVVYSLNRHMANPKNYLVYVTPKDFKDDLKITAPDKWTVDIQCNPEYFVFVIQLFPDFATTDIPHEVVEKYGDMIDWRNAVGTGPFFLTDYVTGSQMTFKRNPNYWGKDPCGPGKGNQLPYLDGVKMLIIPDRSTQLAALRTGKLDHIGGKATRDDALTLIQNKPELQYVVVPGGGMCIFMRQDKADSPTHDKRVRRALHMAIDYDTIVDDYFGGDAAKNVWPHYPVSGYEAMYLSLDAPDCPESVKELFVYNPEKAKQLLTEAGYPNGFKREVVTSSETSYIEILSIIKDMWAKINVEITIKPVEPGAFRALYNARTHEEMLITGTCGIGHYARGMQYIGTQKCNNSYIDDPVCNEAQAKKYAAFNRLDEVELDRLTRELMKYIIDQAWAIGVPKGYPYTLWWPWLKNYHGEYGPGYMNEFQWTKFVWLDQELKAEILGK